MAQLDPVIAVLAGVGAFAGGEDHKRPLPGADHVGTALGPRTLLDQEELAPSEVALGGAEQQRQLQREDERSVEILVQTVVIAGLVFQDQRRRSSLPCLMA